ncbi:class IV adenylate cyclase [Halovivax gelatinilyticus]|uniref:class IV adenylate cyclase n=1 Tax=Halovivax gelatinilyticus TaxID=2961597 RepID=UPI0020CA5D49|nr:class IV adenylate cyclase [Halovivax gelatinilyticus]
MSDARSTYEVEVKVPATLDRVRERVRSIGASDEGRVEQVDTYYDAPHRTFSKTDEALRIRTERRSGDERVELTYKGPLVERASKTRAEVETEVDDAVAAAEILERLGFEPAATVRKDRHRFAFDGVTITLDEVDGVGTYVEVERTATADSIDETRAELFATLDRLGLDPDEQVRTSYLGLMLEGES